MAVTVLAMAPATIVGMGIAAAKTPGTVTTLSKRSMAPTTTDGLVIAMVATTIVAPVAMAIASMLVVTMTMIDDVVDGGNV